MKEKELMAMTIRDYLNHNRGRNRHTSAHLCCCCLIVLTSEPCTRRLCIEANIRKYGIFEKISYKSDTNNDLQ